MTALAVHSLARSFPLLSLANRRGMNPSRRQRWTSTLRLSEGPYIAVSPLLDQTAQELPQALWHQDFGTRRNSSAITSLKSFLKLDVCSRHDPREVESKSSQSQRLIIILLLVPDPPQQLVQSHGTPGVQSGFDYCFELQEGVQPPPIDPIASFLSIITGDTDKSQWLRGNVLSLVLRQGAVYNSSKNYKRTNKQRPILRLQSDASTSDILAIITNLPNPRELNIRGLPLFSDGQLWQLRSTGPNIRSLRIDPDHLTCVVRAVAVRGSLHEDCPDFCANNAWYPVAIQVEHTQGEALPIEPKNERVGQLGFPMEKKGYNTNIRRIWLYRTE
ncbi:hypothetical protein C8R45DRAFT_1082076 [Mycena sanguinolenta]|nr:hypothetical protein C8R45DRAFT_1082076 [Mycena sanguinolenta]